MILKICWLYPSIMDLYGDSGNIKVLQYRCNKRNIKVELTKVDINDEVNFSDYDLVFLGGGADREQSLIKEDLLKRKDNIKEAVNNKVFFFLICGGYQMFGKYYLDSNGNKIEGLCVFDYETNNQKGRCIGNVVLETTIDNEVIQVLGFENHGGITTDIEGKSFANVIVGYGNNLDKKYEGYMDDNALCTYLHGPLLPKNPKIADYIIKRCLRNNYGDIVLEQLDDTLENKAREDLINRFISETKTS